MTVVLVFERGRIDDAVVRAAGEEASSCGAAPVVVEYDENLRFGAAVNAGVRSLAGDLVAVIHAARPLSAGWLGALSGTIAQTGAAVAGPRVRTGDREGCGLVLAPAPDEPRGFVLNAFAGVTQRFECDAVPSACLVTSRATFDALGGFEETFGAELATLDYCLRVAERDGTVVFEPGATFVRDADETGPDSGEAAFAERWRAWIDTRENVRPEITGTLWRRAWLGDRVVAERIPLPKIDVLLHGDPPSEAFLTRLTGARLKPSSAVWADANNAVRAARELTEVRGPGFVAFVHTGEELPRDWLNELVNAIEHTPDIAAATLSDVPGARCTLIAVRKVPQHLRIEDRGSLDASVAAWLGDVERAGRVVVRPRRHAPAAVMSADPPPAEDAFVSIVMLSYNAPDYTEVAIDSIRRNTPTPHEIIIIDNGSGPETVARLERIPGIRVIYNAVNTGFAYGSNQGLAAARGTHTVLLNNDVVVTRGWLEALLAVQQRHPTIGCSAPRSNKVAGSQLLAVPYDDLDDLPAFAAQRAVEQRGRWTHQFRVMGLCMCLDRRVVAEIGGLDPRYGTGNFEDDDYCMRIRAAGYDIAVCEDSFIHHFGSISFKVNRVDYFTNMDRNAALFAERWNVAVVESVYDPQLFTRRGFERERDYVALPPPVAVGPEWTPDLGEART